MTHFLLRQTSVVKGLAAMLFCSATLAHAQETGSALHGSVEVKVRVYNVAKVSLRVRDAAMAVATHALSSVVHLAWRDDAGAGARHPGEFVLRLIRSNESTPAPLQFPLGEAAIDDSIGVGEFATISVDRVEKMARSSHTDTAVLLGRAIAHELGHLLLGTNHHSESGLMRAHWRPEDLRRNRSEDWVLTKESVEAIQQRVR